MELKAKESGTRSIGVALLLEDTMGYGWLIHMTDAPSFQPFLSLVCYLRKSKIDSYTYQGQNILISASMALFPNGRFDEFECFTTRNSSVGILVAKASMYYNFASPTFYKFPESATELLCF